MADERKHLINLNTHTGGNLPTGKLLLGEIAVDHSNVDDAKLFVETNSENPSSATLATFVSKSYIDKAVDELISGETILAEAIESLSGIGVNALTGGTGDDVIDVETDSGNTFTVTHKKGIETSGFNKLSTDEYGHVTASTEIMGSDIADLIVGESGNTGEGALVYDKSSSSFTFYDVMTDVDDFVALSGTTSGASTGSLVDAGLLSKVILENEIVMAAALNKVHDDIKAISGNTGGGGAVGEFLSASTPHIVSIAEVENASGKTTTINYFNGAVNSAVTIVERYIIDCGEY